MFKVKHELHYSEEDCHVSVADDELHFEIELIDFSKVKARMLDMVGNNLEHPKKLKLGKLGDGKVILSYTQGQPFYFTFGKSEIPKGLEMGIGTMSQGEKAVIYVAKGNPQTGPQQYKGLFDKKPGEIAEAGGSDLVHQVHDDESHEPMIGILQMVKRSIFSRPLSHHNRAYGPDYGLVAQGFLRALDSTDVPYCDICFIPFMKVWTQLAQCDTHTDQQLNFRRRGQIQPKEKTRNR
ncbi:hypothetical protein CASFOL_015655 [Castilleja foliolosa]|uniref:peptidylprolyl isomerase n=1 Tax=Castilleja foliolosa TaxID=1961234 RepID=A0ABD3DG77_9LAMI